MFRISEAATVIAVASNLDSVCQSSTSSSYKNFGPTVANNGHGGHRGIEMQQVGQDMTCNSDDDKIVNAKVNNESLS